MKELELLTSDMTNFLMEVLPRREIVEENVVPIAFVPGSWERIELLCVNPLFSR